MRRHLLLLGAALTCPCHLPLLAVLLAGSALGGFVTNNFELLFGAFVLLFGGTLWLWSRQPSTAPAAVPKPPPARPRGGSGAGDCDIEVGRAETHAPAHAAWGRMRSPGAVPSRGYALACQP
ncbi:MAG: hypothetical protein HY690_15610 [Chloroflexi bacterium]|nr:hypothetical protein [Chloroflexota bacterium]